MNRTAPLPTRPDWHRIVENVTLDLANRRIEAARSADASRIPNPARLASTVADDAAEALSDWPSHEFIGGPERDGITSPGMFRAAFFHFVPGWSEPDTKAEILAVVRDVLDCRFGSMRDAYRAAGIVDDLDLPLAS